MPTTRWTIRHFDTSGDGIVAPDMTVDETISDEIKHATNRSLSMALNGIDQLDFTLYLDDPMAAEMHGLSSVVKMWRSVIDDEDNVIYEDPALNPVFAGVVANTMKDGDANTMNVTAFSPLWRLQSRFHLLNHYLKINPDTGDPWTESELIWKLIDLVNEAFGLANSYTGIGLGDFDTTTDIIVAPFFVQRGSNTWANIYDGIMARAGGIDIVPQYYHDDLDPTLMFFSTADKRGQDLSGDVDFRYHTGAIDVLDNLTEEINPIPGEFANYVWAVGHGGPNSGKVAANQNEAEDEYSMEEIGVYMRRADFSEEKLVGIEGPPATGLVLDAQAELAQSRIPKKSYTITLSPTVNVTYVGQGVLSVDWLGYQIGDVVMLNANKGALLVTNQKQRIYEVNLSNSDNNVEIATISVSKDFTGKVAEEV